MTKSLPVSIALIALVFEACATTGAHRGADADRAAVLAADTQFDADVAAGGIDAWVSWLEPAAANWSRSGLAHDREVYRTTLGPLLSEPGTKLRWQPAWAEADGDLGYSTGRWQLHKRAADGGDQIAGSGKYVTIWRRQTDGQWRVVFDMGNDDR
jgi:ketosteroid isomerase-like protein